MNMKTFALIIALLAAPLCRAQVTAGPRMPLAPGFGQPAPAAPDLPRFDLDFPGGTPQQLVDAIKEKIGTLNAIIPTEHKNVRIPPLKMNQVTVPQLFEALSSSSM